MTKRNIEFSVLKNKWNPIAEALSDVAPGMTAVHNMLADVVYTGYAIGINGHISLPLLAVIWGIRFPGSVMLLAGNEGTTRYAQTHNTAFSHFIGNARTLAQSTVNHIKTVVPSAVRNNSPGSFTLGFAAYACAGFEVCREGTGKLFSDPELLTHLTEVAHDIAGGNGMKALSNPAIPGIFQTMAGASVTLGCFSYALSGLEIVKRNKSLHSRLTRAGATISFPTCFLNGMNAYMAGGPTTVKGALLSLLTYFNFAQIIVRTYLTSTSDDKKRPICINPATPSANGVKPQNG